MICIIIDIIIIIINGRWASCWSVCRPRRSSFPLQPTAPQTDAKTDPKASRKGPSLGPGAWLWTESAVNESALGCSPWMCKELGKNKTWFGHDPSPTTSGLKHQRDLRHAMASAHPGSSPCAKLSHLLAVPESQGPARGQGAGRAGGIASRGSIAGVASLENNSGDGGVCLAVAAADACMRSTLHVPDRRAPASGLPSSRLFNYLLSSRLFTGCREPGDPTADFSSSRDSLSADSAQGGAHGYNLDEMALRLTLRLLEEQRRGEASHWRPYVPTIPGDYTPVMWDEATQRKCLAGTPSESRIARRFTRNTAQHRLLNDCENQRRAGGAAEPGWEELLRWALLI